VCRRSAGVAVTVDRRHFELADEVEMVALTSSSETQVMAGLVNSRSPAVRWVDANQEFRLEVGLEPFLFRLLPFEILLFELFRRLRVWGDTAATGQKRHEHQQQSDADQPRHASLRYRTKGRRRLPKERCPSGKKGTGPFVRSTLRQFRQIGPVPFFPPDNLLRPFSYPTSTPRYHLSEPLPTAVRTIWENCEGAFAARSPASGGNSAEGPAKAGTTNHVAVYCGRLQENAYAGSSTCRLMLSRSPSAF